MTAKTWSSTKSSVLTGSDEAERYALTRESAEA